MKLFAILGYLIFSLVMIAAFLEIVSWAGWSLYRRAHPRPHYNEVANPVFAGDAWAQDFWREESARVQVKKKYVPFRLWGVMPWHGKYVNNDESETGIWRRTINPSNSQCAGKQTIQVWMFGGSTVYGAGVPDWATLPSELSRDLNLTSKDCVVVSNFGVEGYTSNQELISLVEQLKAGGHPDLVIFYDGINDSATADPPEGPLQAHYMYQTIKSRIEGSLSQRLLEVLQESYAVRTAGLALSPLHRRASTRSASDSKQQALAVVDNYEENLQIVRALGKAYGFRTSCFWQPSLYYGQKPLVPFEKSEVDTLGKDPRDATIRAAYKEAEQRGLSSQGFVFLGHIFDSVSDPIYLDQVHLGPQGNDLVARALAEYLKHQS